MDQVWEAHVEHWNSTGSVVRFSVLAIPSATTFKKIAPHSADMISDKTRLLSIEYCRGTAVEHQRALRLPGLLLEHPERWPAPHAADQAPTGGLKPPLPRCRQDSCGEAGR